MSLGPARRQLEGFGAHVRRTRKHVGLSVRALAVELGLDHSIITRVENAQWMPTQEQEQILREWMVHHPLSS